MQAAARLAATAAAQRCGLLAAGQPSTLPVLTFQLTSLTSLAGLAGGIDRQQGGGSGAPAANRQQQLPTAAQQPWQQQLLLPGTAAWAAAQQQRPIFNFAGFGGDISKKYHEKKLLGWAGCLGGAAMCWQPGGSEACNMQAAQPLPRAWKIGHRSQPPKLAARSVLLPPSTSAACQLLSSGLRSICSATRVPSPGHLW